MDVGVLHSIPKDHVMIDLHPSSDNGNLNNNGASDTAIRDSAFALKASEFHGHRAIKVWMVVMLSMGYRPTSGVREEILQEKRLKNEFHQRIRFIRANLTAERNLPAPSVLYFNTHPSSALLPDTQDKYVDVVSALQALRRQFGPLPQPVDELELAAAGLPIPRDWVDSVEEAGADPGKSRQPREDKSGSPRVEGSAVKFIRALVELHHGVPDHSSVAKFANDILAEFEKVGIAIDMKEYAIETQLRDAFGLPRKRIR